MEGTRQSNYQENNYTNCGGADLLGPRRELAVGARTDLSVIAHADPEPDPGAGGLVLSGLHVLEARDTTSLDDIL